MTRLASMMLVAAGEWACATVALAVCSACGVDRTRDWVTPCAAATGAFVLAAVIFQWKGRRP